MLLTVYMQVLRVLYIGYPQRCKHDTKLVQVVTSLEIASILQELDNIINLIQNKK